MDKLNGFLDHQRESLELLDEQLRVARRMSKLKGKDKALALQWAKTLRDLVELRNTTLANIKVHLLGCDETGSPNEPSDCHQMGMLRSSLSDTSRECLRRGMNPI